MVDFGKNARHVFVQNAIEINTRIAPRPAQMLNSQPDWSQRILDLMRDLARHFSPCQHALCSRHLDAAELEVARKNSRRDTTEPEGSNRSKGCCEKNKTREITPAPIEHQLVAARRCRKNEALTVRPGRRAISPEDVCLSHRLLPARGELTTLGQAC